MTEIDFIQSHLLQSIGLNRNATININIKEPRDSGPPYIITGLTATVVPKSSSQLSDLKNVLEQVEVVKFDIDNTQFTLEVTDRTFFNSTQVPFYYLRVKQFEIPKQFYQTFNEDLNNTADEQRTTYNNTSIVFEPFITNLQFGFSEFNATISNAIDARKSTQIVQSDRNTSTILPSNFNAIISGTATAAEIQDSIYQETGWSNARYEGSKTTAANYGNVPPTINGTLFPGEQYVLNTSASAILEAPYESRVIEQFFYSGDTRLPKLQFLEFDFENGSSQAIGQLQGSGAGVSSQTQATTVQIEYTDSEIATLKPGDVVTAVSHTIPFIIIKVSGNNITLAGNYKSYPLQDTIPANAQIRVFDPENRIYSFIGESSKVEGASDVKVWIQEENEIAATNEAGTVIYLEKQLQGV